MRTLTIVAASMALAACGGVPAAQMRLPPPVAAGQVTPMTGLTGWNGGQYSLGGYRGGYHRSDSSMTFFGGLKRTDGRYRFDIAGPEISGTIAADCRMRQKELVSSSLSITTGPLAYACDFLADGRAFPARFELQEVLTPVVNRYAREGEIALGGETIHIRSVHELAGTSIPTSMPIGYVFEQGGVPVGAVELNGRPRLVTAVGASAGAQRTMAVAAVALALFRDPA